ncbi:MAG TPA: peptidyl-prolyl cis-trans isomerase [Patescibacteria group bacterium]|jgi:peptidyl-prolyl cis-trans isomerase D|nr:peptidyl-prolyl cis-trans isomerase [Patescibacteria group bacterium]
MITFMRRYRRGLQGGLLLVIAAFVASLFVFGTSGFGGKGEETDTVATVNGESISRRQYQERYQSVLEYYSQSNRGRLSPELAEQLGLPQRVVDEMVTERVVAQRAVTEGLALTDEEFNAAVHAMREFQDNGRFSMDRYRRFLQVRGVEAEQELRRFLTMRKVQRLVVGGIRVTDPEVEQAWGLRREEVRAGWAMVELAPLVAAATASAEEVAEYLKGHPEEFKQPERRKIQYVSITPKDVAPKISDADVEKYYTEHLKEFETPAQVHGVHLLVRVADTGGSEAEDRARAKVAEAIKRAKGGEDLGKIAREMSEDPGSKDKGGDLGWVSKGDMVPQFEQALFALKKGEISAEPVRTPFGFHAVKALDIRPASRKPLKEVAAQIRDRLVAEGGDKAARAKAEEVRPPLVKAGDFMAEARKLGLSPIETTMSKLTRPPGLPPDPLEDAAFSLVLGGVSEPIKTPAGWVVAKVVESIPPGVPPLEQIRDRVTAAVKREKAETAAAGRSTQLVEAAKGGNLEAAAKKVGATFGETPRFSRTKPAEKLPGDAQLAALQTPAGEVSAPVKTPQGYYLVKVLERAPAGPVDPAEREKLARELTGQKQSQIWERWVATARSESKIDVVGRREPKRG